MWQYRLLLISGYVALVIGIIYSVLESPWWLLMSWVYTLIFCAHLGNGVALHRYFVHGSFRTGPLRHRLLCWLSILPGYGSPITLAILHRHHHRYSDTELDTHNPEHGFWHSWLLYSTYKPEYYRNVKQVKHVPKELYKDPLVRWIHENYYRIWAVAFGLVLIIDWRVAIFFVLCPVAFGSINNFFFIWSSHRAGFPGNYRNFDTPDRSQNNRWVALAIGELHNNHHASPGSYDQAVRDGEFDPAGWIVRRFFLIDEARSLVDTK